MTSQVQAAALEWLSLSLTLASVGFTDGITMHGRKPIVWYGTSIDQGGVASRPGATYTNVLTRSLGRMVLNFGFAGNGKDETSVAEYLVRVPAALFVLDCLPNLNAEEVTERTAPLVRYLRAHGHADTPIVLAAGTTYGDTSRSHTVRPLSAPGAPEGPPSELRTWPEAVSDAPPYASQSGGA